MKAPRPEPCPDCPWRLNAAPGWLGPNTAKEWVELAHSDEQIACHLTIRNSDTDTDEMTSCAGAAIYRANVCKRPRGAPASHVLPADREHVFPTAASFVEHHRRAP